MKTTFLYRPEKEYDNFRRSFGSMNHAEPSPRQREFMAAHTELTPENARAFAQTYIATHNIDIPGVLSVIEKQWRTVEPEFFRRADEVFRTKLSTPEIVIYLTIHDRCSYSFQDNEFFLHLNSVATNKTIMHELWHWYFYYAVGQDIKSHHGQTVYNDTKESLTVLLNEIYGDLLHGVTDKGYPQHAKLRAAILTAYRETKDIYQTIERALAFALD